MGIRNINTPVKGNTLTLVNRTLIPLIGRPLTSKEEVLIIIVI
jgi:hypothetical protein